MLESGKELAHFKIIKKLGSGGMGEVFLAEDTKLKRKVAIKILLSEYFEDRERKERFQREARTAAQISHQNVMAIYDIDTAPDPDTGQDLTYIVMEYIEGVSLGEYLVQNDRDMNQLIQMAEYIAAGLAAAHKINVVHRDIKTGNIIIDSSGNPKILDFGLAKPVSPIQMDKESENTDTISQELTKAGKIVGTVSYMSPEQINGEPVDSRSDIFAFGILLYRMATGNSPFEGDTSVSTMAKILESQPESPRLKNEQIPTELERIIKKCLHKKADDRYQDTRDLVVDLRNLRRQFDSDISSSISSIRDLKTEEHNIAKFFKLGWKTITLGIVIIALAIVYSIMGDKTTSRSATVFAGENGLAILGFENKTGNSDLDWLQTGLPEILQTDLAQSDAVSIISRDRVVDCIEGGDPHVGFGHAHKECLRAANFLGAKHAISGTFYKLGDQIRIDARLEELATGKIISTAKVVGLDPFMLVDSLTEKIASALDIGTEMASSEDVSKFTSSSPEAYKKYLEGMKIFGLEKYETSIEEFNKAIEIDSTFALPYMRIGMAYVFTGKNTLGAQWFAKATKYADRLPVRERSLLNVYSDLWLEPNFDDAFIKMETLVNNYPDDLEMRTLYALMVNLFKQDTTAAFAQYDTVLQISPRYLFCLSQIAEQRTNLEQYDLAKELAEQMVAWYPESPTPYRLLGNIYRKQKHFDKSIENFTKMYEIYPKNNSALFALYRLYIYKRDFDKAEVYAEKILSENPDDAYERGSYYNLKSALAIWNGQFKQSINYNHKALNQFIEFGDSNTVQSRYSVVSDLYYVLDMYDSSLYYATKGYEWSSLMFNRANYPFQMVTRDSTLVDSARVLMAQAMDGFRSRLPEDFWPLAEGLSDLFEANIAHDSTAMLAAYQKMYETNPQSNGGMLRSMAFIHAKTGQYQLAVDHLDEYLTDNTSSSSGTTTAMSLYHLGMAYEGLGNTGKAAEAYTKMLGIWSNPDVVIDEIKDARERLAALTS